MVWRWLFSITFSLKFQSTLILGIHTFIGTLPCPASAVLHLVAHIASVVIVCGGPSLIADASIFSATISIIRAWLLVTLTFVGAVTEVSRWFSVLKIGPIITDPANVISASLVNDIFTRIGIHFLPTLTILVFIAKFSVWFKVLSR